MNDLARNNMWTPTWLSTPTEEGMYNVTFDDGFVTSVEWNDGYWGLWDCSGEVIAWMPLPAPYQKEENK